MLNDVLHKIQSHPVNNSANSPMMDMIMIAKKQSLSNNKTPILKSGERPLSASNKKLLTSAD